MKKHLIGLAGVLAFSLIGYSLVFSDVVTSRKGKDGVQTVTITSSHSTRRSKPVSSSYTLIGWNDLGMHCISPSFKSMAILPPYNNLMVQAIKKGDPPSVV